MSLSKPLLRPLCSCKLRIPGSLAVHRSPQHVRVDPTPGRSVVDRPRFQSTTSTPTTATLREGAGLPLKQTIVVNDARRPSRTRGFLTALAVGTVSFVAGYGFCVIYPPGWYRFLFPSPVALPPSLETPAGVAYTNQIERDLQNLPLVQQLRNEVLDPISGEVELQSPNDTTLTSDRTSRVRKWKESRPYSRVPESKKRHSLTQFSLRGPGKFAVNPLVFSSVDNKETIAFIHVGSGMCGHNGIVHGGLLATMLDEAVARPAFLALPNNIGMTVYLNVRYKAPTMADQFLVVKTRLNRASGRKAFVEGEIYDLDGRRLVECDALYIEPKDAWILKTSAVKEALAEE